MPNFDLTIEGVIEHIKQLPFDELSKIAYIISTVEKDKPKCDETPSESKQNQGLDLSAEGVIKIIQMMPDDELNKLADLLIADDVEIDLPDVEIDLPECTL